MSERQEPKKTDVAGQSRQNAINIRRMAILQAIADGLKTRGEIAVETEMSMTAVSNNCTKMIVEGLVKSRAVWKQYATTACTIVEYRLTQAGRAKLDECKRH